MARKGNRIFIHRIPKFYRILANSILSKQAFKSLHKACKFCNDISKVLLTITGSTLFNMPKLNGDQWLIWKRLYNELIQEVRKDDCFANHNGWITTLKYMELEIV